MLLVLSAGLLSPSLLIPTTPPPLLPTPLRTTAAPRAIVALCADDAAEARIGGVPVEEGQGILCRDDESEAWWRATIREVRGSQVLVHFTGCDEAWDTWKESDSPDLMVMDRAEQATADNAFQSDSIEADMDDEELLAEYRRKRWEDNARWQLTTFAQSQLGSWAGELELYELDGDGGVAKRVGPWTPQCSCEVTAVTDNTELELADSLPSVAEAYAYGARMNFDAFRPEVGNMAVANAFSLVSPLDGDDAGWLFEVAIGEGERRVRCKLLYQAEPADGASGGEGGEGGEGGAPSVPAMRLSGLALVREARGGRGFREDGADPKDELPGRGLYDPPPGSKMGYCSLYAADGITLVFPTRVEAGGGGFLSLDWVAGKMRYQIDRKFKQLDGSLSSLELTEILKSDAETYLPDFPHQGGGGSA